MYWLRTANSLIAHSERWVLAEAARVVLGLDHESLVRNDLIHKADAVRLARVDVVADQDHLHRDRV